MSGVGYRRQLQHGFNTSDWGGMRCVLMLLRRMVIIHLAQGRLRQVSVWLGLVIILRKIEAYVSFNGLDLLKQQFTLVYCNPNELVIRFRHL